MEVLFIPTNNNTSRVGAIILGDEVAGLLLFSAVYALSQRGVIILYIVFHYERQ